MGQPSAWNGVLPMLMGVALIIFRRSFAREMKRTRDTFERACDEDWLATFTAIVGGVFVLFGLVLLLLLATA
jgi:hypothetical protein